MNRAQKLIMEMVVLEAEVDYVLDADSSDSLWNKFAKDLYGSDDPDSVFFRSIQAASLLKKAARATKGMKKGLSVEVMKKESGRAPYFYVMPMAADPGELEGWLLPFLQAVAAGDPAALSKIK